VIDKNVVLEGETVILRECRENDCNTIYLSWLNDPNVNKYLETRWTEQTLEKIISFVSEIHKSDHSILFAIIYCDNNTHIGNIKLGPIHPHYNYADVSYFIGDCNYWGKGIATEAIKLVKDYAFDVLGLHRVQAGLFEENVGSKKALEKAGFILEGRQRKQLRINENDKWQDNLIFGAVK
jgi:RimJ/RimL family protein N-acetyltransferase